MVLLIFVTSDQFCQAVRPILPGSLTDFEIGIFLSLSDFVQCYVCQSDAYKNQMDSLAKLVGQQKLDRLWLFHVNDPLLGACAKKFCYERQILIMNDLK